MTILIRKQIHTKIRIQLFVGLITIVIWNLCCVAKISQFCFRLIPTTNHVNFFVVSLIFPVHLYVHIYATHSTTRNNVPLTNHIYIYMYTRSGKKLDRTERDPNRPLRPFSRPIVFLSPRERRPYSTIPILFHVYLEVLYAI